MNTTRLRIIQNQTCKFIDCNIIKFINYANKNINFIINIILILSPKTPCKRQAFLGRIASD